jgi:hypothetical protein
LSSVSPGIGSTDINLDSNIVFTFDKNIRAGVGTITLEVGTGGTSIVESYDVSSSNRLTFSTNTLTIDPTSNLNLNTNYYVIVPNGAVAGYAGISTYNFTTLNQPTTLGASFGGGYAICISGGTVWVVAPNTTEVSRTWYCRDDAVTTAQASAACGDWFVPSFGQLQNPGSTCRTYWNSYSSPRYWSSSETGQPGRAWSVCLPTNNNAYNYKSDTFCVRAFRCVTY